MSVCTSCTVCFPNLAPQTTRPFFLGIEKSNMAKPINNTITNIGYG